MAIDVNIPSQVKNYANLAAFPVTGSLKTIFIAEDTNKTYRWTGSAYVEISAAGSTAGLVPYTGATGNVNLGSNNLTTNNVFDGFTSVVASATLITLTIASTPSYLITGSGGQTIKLPDATTLPKGAVYNFNNNQSSGAILVNNNSNTLVKSVPSGGNMILELTDNSIAAGSWDAHFQAPSNVSWSTNTFDYAGSITGATWNGVSVADNRIASSSTWNAKQDALVSGTNIKTVNGTTILGSGDLTISTGITIGTTAITSGTVGRVLFEGTGNVVSESANLFWDNTNGRLGIGGTPSTFNLDVVGTAKVTGNTVVTTWIGVGGVTTPSGTGEKFNVQGAQVISGASGAGNFLLYQISGVSRFIVGSEASIGGTANNYINYVYGNNSYITYTNNVARLSVTGGGNVLINTTTDAGYRLDVNGTARFTGAITLPFSASVTINSSTNDMVFNVPFYYRIMSTGADTGTVISSMWNGAQMVNGLNRKTVITNVSGNGTSSGTITASAILDVQSTTLGFLPPRMTTTQKNAIASPASGLMIYDTTLNVITYYNGTTWI